MSEDDEPTVISRVQAAESGEQARGIPRIGERGIVVAAAGLVGVVAGYVAAILSLTERGVVSWSEVVLAQGEFGSEFGLELAAIAVLAAFVAGVAVGHYRPRDEDGDADG